MAIKYELDFTLEETGEVFSILGGFSDDAVKLLERFVICAEEVWQTTFIQSGQRGQATISFRPNEGITTKTTLPDWNQVIVFLHKFRPILLESESLSFKNIQSLLGRHFDNEFLRNFLKLQGDLYYGKADESYIQIKSNKVPLESEKVLFDWLNSHEFHRDEEKAEFIESLHQMIPLEVSKVIFLRLLIDKATASLNLAMMIQLALGKQRELIIHSFEKSR